MTTKKNQLNELSIAEKEKIEKLKEIGQKMKDVNNIFTTGKRMNDNMLMTAARSKLAQLAKMKHDLDSQVVSEELDDSITWVAVFSTPQKPYLWSKFSATTEEDARKIFYRMLKRNNISNATLIELKPEAIKEVFDIGGLNVTPVSGPGARPGGKEDDSQNHIEEGWKSNLAGAALAGSMALGGAGTAHAAPDQPATGAKASMSSSFKVGGYNSPEYDQKNYPIYQKMLQDYMASHPGMDSSLARDVVNNRWKATYHTQVPQQSFTSQPALDEGHAGDRDLEEAAARKKQGPEKEHEINPTSYYVVSDNSGRIQAGPYDLATVKKALSRGEGCHAESGSSLIKKGTIREDASAGATGSASVATVVSGTPGIIKRTGNYKKKGRYGNSVTPKTFSAIGKGIYEAILDKDKNEK